MHTGTCFDSKESSSGYSMNRIIDTSSGNAHSEIPKKFTWKNTGKIVQNYYPDVLNIYSN